MSITHTRPRFALSGECDGRLQEGRIAPLEPPIFSPFGQKMNAEQPRTVFVTVRFTPHEAAEIAAHAGACGHSMSALVRARCLGHSAPRGAAPEVNLRAWRELAATAANLNQLAHHLNSHAKAGQPEVDLVETSALLVDLQNKVKTLRLQLLGAE